MSDTRTDGHGLRVVHSHPVWLPQTQTWMYSLVKSLPDEVESHIVCERTANLDQFAVGTIHCAADRALARVLLESAARRLRFRRHLGYLVEILRSTGAQVLHSHFGTAGWFDLGAARAAGVRHVVTFYGSDISEFPQKDPEWRERYRKLFSCVNRVLCEGPHMASGAVSLGCPQDKVSVLRLGILLDRLPFQPRTWSGQGPLKVLIAATFREKKGIPYGLAAVGAVAQQLPLTVTIIGDAVDEPESRIEKDNIGRQIKEHGLQDRVRFLGFQSHDRLLAEAYRHHVFLAPSVTGRSGDTEGGCPVSIIELAASGMPVVSTRHCDIPDVIPDGECGLLAGERDVSGLSEHLLWLGRNPGGWKDLQERARLRIEERHDPRKQAQALLRIYREVCA
jgi:colanic acid/amylovoran biosynthesis glycosyltransferase